MRAAPSIALLISLAGCNGILGISKPGSTDLDAGPGSIDSSVTRPFDAAADAAFDAGPVDGLVWNLAADFRVAPDQQNPSQDGYGNPDVWYYLGSETLAHDPATYRSMDDYNFALWDYDGLEGWFDSTTGFEDLPHACINSSGSDMNPFGQVVWPAGAVLIHPTPANLAIVGWKSPITGTVEVGGRATDRNSTCGNGVLWFVAHNDTDLASGALDNGGAQYFSAGLGGDSLAAVTVSAGDFLYVIVDPRDGEYVCDSTQLDVTITEM